MFASFELKNKISFCISLKIRRKKELRKLYSSILFKSYIMCYVSRVFMCFCAFLSIYAYMNGIARVLC